MRHVVSGDLRLDRQTHEAFGQSLGHRKRRGAGGEARLLVDTHRIVSTRLHASRRHKVLQRCPTVYADRELVVNSAAIVGRQLKG